MNFEEQIKETKNIYLFIWLHFTWIGVYKTDMTWHYIFLCMFMTTVIKCHSLSYVSFNAKMTIFEMSVLWARVRGMVRSNNVIFALKMT